MMATYARRGAAALAAGLAIMGIVFGMGLQAASAAVWCDTSIGWRYGTKFAEPF